MTEPVVLITGRYPDALLEPLRGRAVIRQGNEATKGMSRAEALAQLHDAVAVVTNAELRIDAELLAAAPKLKLAANATAGFDNMDVAAMRARGVWGTNSPDAFSADTATHAIALMLALTRRLFEADAYVRAGHWERDGWMPGGRWDGMALEGKHFGVIGLGHIGRQAARRAAAFGMEVRHHSRSGREEPGWMALPDLLAWADVVSLHCPLTAETQHLINAATIAQMKPGAFLLNVSRGKVVDLAALVPALASGHLAGAGLDVFEDEPAVPEAVRALPNVVLSPHMGGCTQEARESAWRTCIKNVRRVIAGETPATPVFQL